MSKESIIYPQIITGLIRVIGIFNYSRNFDKSLLANGFVKLEIAEPDKIDITKQFYRDKYYTEFNELLLTRNGDDAVNSFTKEIHLELNFLKGKENIRAVVKEAEIHLFDDEIGVFSVTVEPSRWDFNYISDLLYSLKSFSSIVVNENVQLHEWFSKFILSGIALRSTQEMHVESDDYSGSKFKIFSVFDVSENTASSSFQRDELLYELGTGSLLGSLSDFGYYAPSREYYFELMQNRVSAFNNWSALALLDSYTAIGQDVLSTNGQLNAMKLATYKRQYFSIYLFNLYMKYNVFRFNTKFKQDPVKYKMMFEDFMNNYNFSHISFDFLPNLIYSKMRTALGIEEEIKSFEKRLVSLAANIQEEQQKRQALLLGIISIITSIGAAEPFLEYAESIRSTLDLSPGLYYTMITILAVLVAIPILAFLFPTKYKLIKKKIFPNETTL